MNNYTTEFHNSSFPGMVKKLDANDIKENFWNNKNIPFVELDLNFNHQDTYNWLLTNNHLFTTVESQVAQQKEINSELGWFKSSRSYGWESLYVKGTPYKDLRIVSDGKNKVEPIHRQNYITAVPDLQTFFSVKRIPVNRLWVFRLQPGGWVQPHKDQSVDGVPNMSWFWTPLHEFQKCLKIYPYGYLEHRLGCMYLFNNSNFMHSVINQSQDYRYVAVGEVDVKNLPYDLNQYIINNAINQWA
jgi:hypothetical protein